MKKMNFMKNSFFLSEFSEPRKPRDWRRVDERGVALRRAPVGRGRDVVVRRVECEIEARHNHADLLIDQDRLRQHFICCGQNGHPAWNRRV